MEFLVHYIDGRTTWREMGPNPPVEWLELGDKITDAHGNEYPCEDCQIVLAREGNMWAKTIRFVPVMVPVPGRRDTWENHPRYFEVPDGWKQGDPVPNWPPPPYCIATERATRGDDA